MLLRVNVSTSFSFNVSSPENVRTRYEFSQDVVAFTVSSVSVTSMGVLTPVEIAFR